MALIISAGLLASCSAIRWSYDYAPNLAYIWLDDHVNFNDAQEPQVRAALAQLLAWHRAEELGKTADFLAQTAPQLRGEISAEQACRAFGQARQLLGNIAQEAWPAAAAIAPSLSAEQLAQLNRKFEKTSAEFRKTYLQANPERQLAKRQSDAVKRGERLYGKLQEPQRAAVLQNLAQSSFDATVALRESQRRQQDLLAVLSFLSNNVANLAPAANAQTALRDYWQRVWDSPDAAYRLYAQRQLQETCENFARLHASTTAQQRSHAEGVLKDYEAQLRAISAQK